MPVNERLAYRDMVRDEWIDYNGHLSEPFYVMVFGFATTAMMSAIGLGDHYRAETGASLYTVEAHVRYLREVHRNAELLVTTSVLSVGSKKVRFCHEMHVGDALVATEELLALHVRGGASQRFPRSVLGQLEEYVVAAPDYAGRSIYG
ncbi:MAG: thioesterase family protein [Sciscionella sp.]